MLHVLQHGIDLENVHAPAAAEEYARRLAQRGVPIAALLRAYRIGSARFEDWCLQELGRRTESASVISATGMRIAGTLTPTSTGCPKSSCPPTRRRRRNGCRNQSAARAARVRALLRNEQPDVASSEAILGYRLRQHHLGAVTWITGGAGRRWHARAAGAGDRRSGGAGGLRRAAHVPPAGRVQRVGLAAAGRAARRRAGRGERQGHRPAGTGSSSRSASPGSGVAGFRRTHQQAVSAQAVALAAGPAGPPVTAFAEVAPLALMSGSLELLRAWVAETLGPLADDDDHNARLRDTLRVFLQENGSYKATAERLVLHKNTVQYRVRKAEESLRHPVVQDRLRIELALLAAQWLGAAVLRPARPALGPVPWPRGLPLLVHRRLVDLLDRRRRAGR